MAVSVTLEFTQQARTRLTALGLVLKGAQMNGPLLAAARPVVERAREIVHVVTGNLRDSIKAEISEDGIVSVGSHLPYAAREEFGFVGVDSLGRHYNRGPHPYLRPAAYETIDDQKAFFTAAVANVLKSI